MPPLRHECRPVERSSLQQGLLQLLRVSDPSSVRGHCSNQRTESLLSVTASILVGEADEKQNKM